MALVPKPACRTQFSSKPRLLSVFLQVAIDRSLQGHPWISQAATSRGLTGLNAGGASSQDLHEFPCPLIVKRTKAVRKVEFPDILWAGNKKRAINCICSQEREETASFMGCLSVCQPCL